MADECDRADPTAKPKFSRQKGENGDSTLQGLAAAQKKC